MENNVLGIRDKIDLILSRIDNNVTRNTKRSIINKFIKEIGIKDKYDTFDAMQFYNNIQDNYTGMSMHLVQQNIKWLYKRMNFDYGYIPADKNECVNNVPLGTNDVIKIINNIGSFSFYTQFVIAMSVVYGLRRIEIHTISDKDINMDNHTIFITTAKVGKNGGRWMYIPDEIRGIVETYFRNYNSQSLTHISSLFWLVISKCNIDINSNRGGWHMVRRRLIIELTKVGLTDNEIVKFMRWKTKDNISSMLYRYTNTEPNDEMIMDIDRKVLKVHPFLLYFNKGGNNEQNKGNTMSCLRQKYS